MTSRAALGLVLLSTTACWFQAAEPAAGTEDGPCRADRTCDPGLACLAGTCVAAVPAPPDAAGTPPDAAEAPGDAHGDGDCDPPRVCPLAASGKVNVCGRVYDVEDSLPVGDAVVDALEVRVYQPLVFVTNPSGQPLVLAPPLDRCGRYEVTGLDAATLNGLVAVAVDDRTGSGADERVLTGTRLMVQAGKSYSLNAWTTRRTTDAAWSAGLTGDSFATRGVFLAIFIDPRRPRVGPFTGTPVEGVAVTKNLSPIPAQDFYFTDTDPLAHLDVDMSGAQTATGKNGAVLSLDGELSNYAGSGAEPAGCVWPHHLAAAVPGVVFVQERVAIDPNTNEECHP